MPKDGSYFPACVGGQEPNFEKYQLGEARDHFRPGLLCDEIRDAQETLGGGERSVQRFGLPAEWSPSPSEEEWK